MRNPVIVDEIESVVDLVRENSTDLTFDETFSGPGAPFFMPGHLREIANNLLDMDEDKVAKYRKYPLFALNTDIQELVEGGIVSYNLNIAILAYTDPNYTTRERLEKVFKATLYPLYDRFMEQLEIQGFFWEGEFESFPHTKIDRFFWGTEQRLNGNHNANVGYPFNDPLDAIEIVNLKIKKYMTCKPY